MHRSLSIAAIAAALPSALAKTIDLPVHFINSYANIEAEIGTPPQTYMLHFDTGSSTAWVTDYTCGENCPNNSGYQRIGYNDFNSSTSVNRWRRGSIEYFGGVTAGPTFLDKFGFVEAGDDTPVITWNQTFISATQSSWNNMPADGFMGLAFSTIADAETTTVLETLLQQGSLDEPRFGLYYGKNFDTTGPNPEGVLTIGGSREADYVDGEINYIPMAKEAEFQVWRATLASITGTSTQSQNGSKEGGKKVSSTKQFGSSGRAVFDTGAGSIQIPASAAESIYASIGMNWTAIIEGDHMPLCSEFNDSWSVTFNFGDGSDSAPKLTMTGSQLARPGFAHREDACNPPFDTSDVDGDDGFALIGTPLLHQFYTIWDLGSDKVENYSPRIGFGELKESAKP